MAVTGPKVEQLISSTEIYNAHDAYTVTPSDSTETLGRGVWVSPTVPATPGTVALMPLGGTVAVVFPVPANASFFIPIAIKRVMATGTAGVTAVVFV